MCKGGRERGGTMFGEFVRERESPETSPKKILPGARFGCQQRSKIERGFSPPQDEKTEAHRELIGIEQGSDEWQAMKDLSRMRRCPGGYRNGQKDRKCVAFVFQDGQERQTDSGGIGQADRTDQKGGIGIGSGRVQVNGSGWKIFGIARKLSVCSSDRIRIGRGMERNSPNLSDTEYRNFEYQANEFAGRLRSSRRPQSRN